MFSNWFQFYLPLLQIMVMNTWQKNINIEPVLKILHQKVNLNHNICLDIDNCEWIILATLAGRSFPQKLKSVQFDLWMVFVS